MKRVLVLTLLMLVVSSSAWPQAAKVQRIGYIAIGPAQSAAEFESQSLARALRARGLMDGKNVVFDRRYAAMGEDVRPLAAAVVKSGAVSPKQLDLLLEIVPKTASVAVVWNPDNLGSATVLRGIQEAAKKLGKRIIPVEASAPQDIAPAFAKMAKEKADALIVIADPFLNLQPIAELAIKQRLPSMGSLRGHAEGGCLASYGSDRAENYARAAYYVDRLLKGAKPGDLPVEQSTKFEFLINRRTAKALGLAISPALLARADRVIE